MAVNLSRNTRVFFTTYNVDKTTAPSAEVATSYVGSGGSANIWEINVLAGYNFTQNTEQETITLSEAGTAPVRGERSFNSKLNPVDWNLSTYIRPYKNTNVSSPEKFLWNALLGAKAINTTALSTLTGGTITGNTTDGYLLTITKAGHTCEVGDSVKVTGITGLTVTNSSATTNGNGIFKVSAISGSDVIVDLETFTAPTGTATMTSATLFTGQWYETTTNAQVTTQGSNKNSLQAFALLFLVDNVWYKVYNCAANQAEIQFDLQGIAMVAWTGFGTDLAQLTNAAFATPAALVSGAATAGFVPVDSLATKYITNKLSTTTLISNIGGTAGTTYTVPITGGSLTINNNIEFVTPENLGVVNRSIGYFTGSRTISGSLNAYLKTGSANESGKLLSDILAGLATTSETKYKLQVEVGGLTNQTRVELLMNGCQLQVPTLDVQDVVSTTINFTAQGSDTPGASGIYNINRTNNLYVTYVGV